jgi:diacylglycerol O-acyltransferase
MAAGASLSVLDAAFLHLEDDRTPMHLASIGIFEGAPLLDDAGALRLSELRELMSYRLQLVPRLHQRVQAGLWHQAPPAWEDDKSFDIGNHVWEWKLPAPGDETQLLDACGELLAQPLDRSRPLWELVFVTGLSQGRIAVVEKLHHSMADGISTAELATVLLDLVPEPPERPRDYHWVPGQVPTPDERNVHDLVALAETAFRLPAWIGWSVAHPVRRVRSLHRLGQALLPMLPTGLFTRLSSLNRQIGPRRAVHLVRADFTEVHATARAHGATVNDVVLAAVTGGLRAILVERNELRGVSKVQAVVPVGLDGGINRTMGNRLSALFVPLPVAEKDPERALATISSTTERQKEQHRQDVPPVVLRLLDPTPQGIVAGATHLLRHQPIFNLVVTNVPGPATPLYLMGARLLEAFPLVPLLGNQGLSVAVLSYDGRLTLGVSSDPESVPDIDVFCEGVSATLAHLSGRPAR